MRARLLLLATLSWAAACDPGMIRPGADPGDGDPVSPQDPALGWLGTFQGDGAGSVEGEDVRWSNLSLQIRFDEAGDAAGCGTCLTLTLGDGLFRAVNVRPSSAVELEVVRDDQGLRTLRLRRYSGAGGTGNVVEADLVVEDSAGVTLEALFVLARK